MVTQKQFKEHYQNLKKNSAIYVWGANGEIITKELTDKLFRSFGSATYTKTYYDNKFKEGAGKIGADCSGSIYPLSKKDNTARGYYNACPTSQRGSINNMPMDVACLVFNAGFTHVGAYMGDGTTIEMQSSKANCVKQSPWNKSRWAYYGIPSWLEKTPGSGTTSTDSGTSDVQKPLLPTSVKGEIIRTYQEWLNSFVGQKLVLDGSYGPKTKKASVMAIQKILNEKFSAKLTVDGSFGPKTKAACVNASDDHDLTYIVQAYFVANNYEMNHSIKSGALDKDYGKGMKNTVLLYQQNTYGLRHDGVCGAATLYAMFK